MSELNQAPQSVEAPSDEFFRTGTVQAAPSTDDHSGEAHADSPNDADGSSGPAATHAHTNGADPGQGASSQDNSSSEAAAGSNGSGESSSANGSNGSGRRAATLVSAAKAALGSKNDTTKTQAPASNGAKVSVAPNVSDPNAVNSKAINPNPANPNVSALGAPVPTHANPNTSALGAAPVPGTTRAPDSSHAGRDHAAVADKKSPPVVTSGPVGQPPPVNSAHLYSGAPNNTGTAPVAGQVNPPTYDLSGRTVATSAPRPAVPYPPRNSGLTGQVRRTLSGAGVAAGAVVSGSMDAVRTAAGSESVPGSVPTQAGRRTRKARLRLSRIDPWSVMKTSFLFAIAGGIILFVAVWVVWGVINASGAFESINKAFNDLIANPGAETKFTLESYVNTQKVLGFTALIAAADVVIFTALATLFSFLYNLAATVLGGLEVTLAED